MSADQEQQDENPLHDVELQTSYQPRDSHGRWSSWGSQQVDGYLEDESERSLWVRQDLATWPRKKLGDPLRYVMGAIYLRAPAGFEKPPPPEPEALPVITQRRQRLGLLFFADVAIAVGVCWYARWPLAEWIGKLGTPIILWALMFSTNVSVFWVGWRLWPPPPPPEPRPPVPATFREVAELQRRLDLEANEKAAFEAFRRKMYWDASEKQWKHHNHETLKSAKHKMDVEKFWRELNAKPDEDLDS